MMDRLFIIIIIIIKSIYIAQSR